MITSSPSETVKKLVEYINVGNIDGAMTLYENNASFVTAPGTVVFGADAIRESLRQMISVNPKLKTISSDVLQANGIALYQSSWQMSFMDGDGNELTQVGVSSDVLVFNPIKGWLIQIDNPWGSAVLQG